ncbi:hypothetical protein GS682_02930 [Nostoc sp. B(2019)]|nr:hypothetical protein [Nostoc sp. B(2019)]
MKTSAMCDFSQVERGDIAFPNLLRYEFICLEKFCAPVTRTRKLSAVFICVHLWLITSSVYLTEVRTAIA